MAQNIEAQNADDPGAVAGHAPGAIPGVVPGAIPGAGPVLSAEKVLSILGWELIAVWVIWWAINLINGQMILGLLTWIPAWRFLGLDFYHNYSGAIWWLGGTDPYTHYFGDNRGLYAYPPIVLPLFGWCGWLTFPLAMCVMSAFIAYVVTIATGMSLRFRRVAGLAKIPAPLAIGAVLMSMPVLFAMERGNCDAYVLLLMVVAAWAMSRGRGVGWDVLAGASLAIAAWIKIYPGLVMLGLLALRRYRVFAVAVVVACATWALAWKETLEWMVVSQNAQQSRVGPLQNIVAWFRGATVDPPGVLARDLLTVNHSVATYWSSAWVAAGQLTMAIVPGALVAMVVLFPLLVWVSYRVFRSRAGDRMCYPYLLWVAMIGTYLMPLSYDYNLIYLPLLIVAVWDWRDSRVAQLFIAVSLLWWQPLALSLPHTPDVMMAAKVLSTIGATMCLMRRVNEAAGGAVAEHTSPVSALA